MKRIVSHIAALSALLGSSVVQAAPIEVVNGTEADYGALTLDVWWSRADGTNLQQVGSVDVNLDDPELNYTGSWTWGVDTINLNIGGNVDPIITIAAGVVDGGAPSSFFFTVSAPLVPTLYGLQNYDLRLSGSFADGGTNGGSVGLGTATVLPIANLANATLNGTSMAGVGVPVGFPSPIALYGPYANVGTFDCGILGCTSFGIDLSFLGSGSGDALSFTGRFTINPVPVPAAVWLMGSALGLLAYVRRRSGA
jgi:hypothetical protein